MKICKPMYQDSLLQVANSTRAFLNLSKHHASSKVIDDWIQKEQLQQLVVLLIDGMGAMQVANCLAEDGFFRCYQDHIIQSVFPSTTVAATTSLRTGLTPAQTRYLGWHQYQPSVDDSVTMFQSRGYYDGSKKYPGLIAKQYPYQSIVEEARQTGKQSCEIFPYWKGNNNHTLDDICNSTLVALQEGNQFVYSYWDEYDSYMHDHGVYEQGAVTMLQNIEQVTEAFAKKLPKHCGLIVLADHGHVDVIEQSLFDYPDIMDCLLRRPTLELRCVNFYIKQECKEAFLDCFQEHFSDGFRLYTREQAIQEKLFGNFGEDETWSEELGDYLAIAIGDKILTCGEGFDGEIKGYHAGMCQEEMEIPLILYPKHSNHIE